MTAQGVFNEVRYLIVRVLDVIYILILKYILIGIKIYKNISAYMTSAKRLVKILSG